MCLWDLEKKVICINRKSFHLGAAVIPPPCRRANHTYRMGNGCARAAGGGPDGTGTVGSLVRGHRPSDHHALRCSYATRGRGHFSVQLLKLGMPLKFKTK